MQELIKQLLEPVTLYDTKKIFDADGTLLRVTTTEKTVAPHSLSSVIKLVELLNKEQSVKTEQMAMDEFKSEVLEMLNEHKRDD